MIDKEQSREIRRQIRRVLMAQWDPIGVNGIPEAADEYDIYIGDIYGLVIGNAGLSKIVEYLRWVEVVRMELVDKHLDPFLAESVRSSAATSLMALRPK